MPRLTKSYIDNCPIPSPKSGEKYAQAFFRDDTLSGFGLRVNSGGTKTYIVETRIAGKVKRITLGRHGALTCEQARKLAKSILGDVASGKDPIAEKKAHKVKGVTLSIAFNNYLDARHDLKPGTIQDYKRCIETSLKDWLPKKLININKDLVEKKHRELGRNSHARANNTMRVLRAIFNYAREQYENESGETLFPVNPVDRLSKNRSWYPVQKRRRLLKPHNLKPWYDATLLLNNETSRDYLYFVLLTGLRRTEAASLKKTQIDLKDKTFTIPDTKNGEPHTLPLSDYLFNLVEKRIECTESEWLFPSPLTSSYLTDPRESINHVSRAAGVVFTLHDLRRTFITIAESLDIPAYALKALLNHKNSNDVTAGYIVSDVNRLREPMQKITDYIMEHFING